MPKIKTRKSTAKRFKVTSKGKFLRRKAFKSHLLQKKSQKRKNRLSQTEYVLNNEHRIIKLNMPYS